MVKPRMSLAQLLEHRYLISVEGNDVATNLKWVLYSNSTPFMPPPTTCSWLMEDQLQPWVHYVPLQPDFSDLVDKVKHCNTHVDQCYQIALNGRRYIEEMRFLNPVQEKTIKLAVVNSVARLTQGMYKF